jgi:hypothetical protein
MEPYLRDNEIADIFARRWTVDCLRMQVLRQSSGEVIFEGAGAIRFSEEGNIEYVVYDTKNTVSVENLFGGMGVLSGEWLEADHFYRLKATDWRGRTSTAEWLDADTHSSADIPGAVVRGRIRELR